MRLGFFIKSKYQTKVSSTIILSVGIKYSVRDLLYDVNNYTCMTRKIAICVIDK